MNKSKIKNNNKIIWIVSLLTILTAVSIMWLRSEPVNCDTPWHISIGDWIRSNSKVPAVDVFSQHTVMDRKTLNFTSHQWLSDVIMSILHSIGKLNLLYAVILITVIGGYIYVIKQNEASDRVMTGVIILALSYTGVNKFIYVTPDTYAVILMMIMNYRLVKAMNKGVLNKGIQDKSFITLLITHGLLTTLLSNLHGGMLSANLLLQVLILGCYVIFYKKDKNRISKAAIILLSSLIGGLINPYGIGIYGYGIMVNISATEYIIDWQPFAFTGALQIAATGIIVLTLIIGIFIKTDGKRKIKEISPDIILDIVMICTFAAMLFLYQRTRNIFVFGIALYGSKYISLAINHIWTKIKAKYKKVITVVLSVLFAMLFIFAIINTCKEKITENMTIQEYAKKYYITEEMIEYLTENQGTDKGRMFNAIENGGFLMCLGFNPYIDGRIDPYVPEYGNEDVFTNYYKALHSIRITNYTAYMEKLNCFILEKNNINSQIMYASDYWTAITESENAVMFIRNPEKWSALR